MSGHESAKSEDQQAQPQGTAIPVKEPGVLADVLALIFTMSLPSVMSSLEFVFVPRHPEWKDLLLNLYWVGKAIQFSFPLIFLWLVLGRFPLRIGFTGKGIGLGAGFGLVVGAGALILYFVWFKQESAFDTARENLHKLLEDWGLDTPVGYWAMCLFVVLLHSLMEEYYWRWFVFGRLRRFLSLYWAAAVAGLAFMAHHVIILWVYFPEEYFWLAAVPFSLCTAGGGFVWAWLYERSGSLYGPWLSHLLVDLAVVVLGYDMLAPHF